MREIGDGVPPDELRCIRDSGSGWRCSGLRFQDKSLCEKHCIQMLNRSATKKRRRSLTFKVEETNEDQLQIEEDQIDKQIKQPKTRAGEEVGDGVPPSTPPAEANGFPLSTSPPDGVPPSTPPAEGDQPDELCCLHDRGRGRQCNELKFQGNKLCKKHYNESQQHSKKKDTERKRSRGKGKTETKEDQVQIEEEHIVNVVDKLTVHPDWVGGRCVSPQDKQIKQQKTRTSEVVGDGVPPLIPLAEGVPPTPPVNGVPPSTPTTGAVPPSMPPANGVPPPTPPPDGVQPDELCCLLDSGRGKQCNGLRFQGNKFCKKHYNESQRHTEKKDTMSKRSLGKSKMETKEDEVQIEEEHIVNGVDKLIVHPDWFGWRRVSPQDKIKRLKTRAGEEVGDGVPPSTPPVNGVSPSMPPDIGVPPSISPPDGVPPSTSPPDGVPPSTPPTDGVQPDELCCLHESGRGRQCNELRFQGNTFCKKHYNESQQRSKINNTKRKKSLGRSKTETKADQVQVEEEDIVNRVDMLIVHPDCVGGKCVSPPDKMEQQRAGLGEETGGQSKEMGLEGSTQGDVAIPTQVSLFDGATLENEMYVESMKLFDSMPQRPHFQPLQEKNEELRQGLALGYLVSFANMLKKIRAAQLDEPKSVLESKLNALVELEAVGFNVKVVRARLEELLQLKDSHVEFEEELKGVEGRMTSEKHKEVSLELEVAEVDELLRELEERRKKLVMDKQSTRSSISALDERRREISEGIQGANGKFTRVAGAPW